MQTGIHFQPMLSIFGAPQLSLESLTRMNDQIKPMIYYGSPIIIASIILELVAQWRDRDKSKFDHKEHLLTIFTGLGYFISSYVTKAFIFGVIVWSYNLIPWRMELHWWMLIPCYIIHDFSFYWRHRVSHESRIWWAIHVTHHSADHYNLLNNFRQSWFEQLCVVFYIPMLIFGFHPVLFFIVHQLNAIIQFWVHTEYIGRFPKWIEYIFITPVSHQVHHGSNEKYLDKNFGNTFIIWDRMFGTFAEMDEKPVYGLTEPLRLTNVFQIVFHEAIDMARDIKNAKTLKEGFVMVFASPAKISALKKGNRNNLIINH